MTDPNTPNRMGTPNGPPVLSVSELTYLLKGHVESIFSDIIVTGEISNYTNPKSGHSFFTLKDDGAQLSSVIWRFQQNKTRFELKNGLAVICHGHLEIYAPYGKYQLIVTRLEPAGIGALELAFRQLHEKLSAAGLFAPSRKKPIPKTLRRVVVITSETGAAIRDFLNIVRHRTSRLEIILVPVAVQGETASSEISAAIQNVNRLWGNDPTTALVLIRGGGSMEDLWSFNEEATVRALADSKLPTVTGIGHEIDVSLSDLAADLHALTPSDAAARLTPDDSLLPDRLADLGLRLERSLNRRIQIADDILIRLANSALFTAPDVRIIEPKLAALASYEQNLTRAVDSRITHDTHRLGTIAGQLEALSPLSVLARGYSLSQAADGTVLRSTRQLTVGQSVRTRLEEGEFTSVVTAIGTENNEK